VIKNWPRKRPPYVQQGDDAHSAKCRYLNPVNPMRVPYDIIEIAFDDQARSSASPVNCGGVYEYLVQAD